MILLLLSSIEIREIHKDLLIEEYTLALRLLIIKLIYLSIYKIG